MKLLLILAIVAAAAYAFDESSFTERSDPETMLLNVKTSIATMKKKGATNSDCKNLAKTACKEVESDRRTSQKTLDALDSGAKCTKLGQKAQARSLRAYKAAKARYARSRRALKQAKKGLLSAKSAPVKNPSVSFSSVSKRKCFRVTKFSKSYRKANRRHAAAVKRLKAAKKIVLVFHIKVPALKKAWHRATKVALKMKTLCQCAAQKTARKVWKVAGAKNVLKKMALAHHKCKMMSCVLAGTNISNKKCQGSLPALRMKKLKANPTRAQCMVKRCKMMWSDAPGSGVTPGYWGSCSYNARAGCGAPWKVKITQMCSAAGSTQRPYCHRYFKKCTTVHVRL